MIGEHHLTVQELINLLKKLDSKDILIVNRLGNLSIVRAERLHGFINMFEGISVEDRLELYDEN